MQGSQRVIDTLNQLLTAELTAMDVYFLHARMCDDWGLKRLAERLHHEFDDEKGHAGRLVDRILFLEGVPDVVPRLAFKVGSNAEEMLRNDLALEHDVARNLNAAIKLCEDENDTGSAELLRELLRDTEEDHILWLQTQIRLIGTVGLENFLAQQMHGDG